MKKLLLPALLFLFIMFGCSEKDDNTTSPNTPQPPAMATVADSVFSFPAEDTSFPVDIIQQVTYNGESANAIPLSYFITKSMADQLVESTTDDETRKLFAYQIVASDGFNPRNRGYADMVWDTLNTGYLLPNNTFRTYFPSDVVPTAFDVKNAATIKMFRAVQVVKADGSVVLFEMNGLQEYQTANYDSLNEAAVKLKDFITTYITTTPASYKYELVDNTETYVKEYTWDQIQDGYWLKETKRTIFPSYPDMPNSSRKFKKLMKIRLVPLS
jgi:hypothetical protein